jgi:hypothetical protein
MSPGVQRSMCRWSMHSREDLVGLLRLTIWRGSTLSTILRLSPSGRFSKGNVAYQEPVVAIQIFGYFRPITSQPHVSALHCHQLRNRFCPYRGIFQIVVASQKPLSWRCFSRNLLHPTTLPCAVCATGAASLCVRQLGDKSIVVPAV